MVSSLVSMVIAFLAMILYLISDSNVFIQFECINVKIRISRFEISGKFLKRVFLNHGVVE